MKRVLFLLVIFAALALAQLPQHTDKYVNDFAGIFTAAETSELRPILAQVENNTTSEVVVVTVNTTAPYVPSQYRTMLFDEWGVGKADVDNGLLILYAATEHRIEVEVGYGLEGILPDSKVGRMLDDYYVPLRDTNQTAKGIIEFTKAVAVLLNENRDEILSHKAGSNIDMSLAFFFVPIIMGIIFLIIVISLSKQKKGKKDRSNKWLWFGGGLGGGRFGGGGGGFGGGGFGGGGFGGGGSGGGGAGR